jgi:glycosyltransferase involved in cell wall biosynthesis
VTGWIVPPCDESALADAMVRLVCDRGLVRRIGRSARLEAEEQHTWRHTVVKLDEIFTKVKNG